MRRWESKFAAVVAARAFAIRAHAGQKYGEHRYVVHLDEVFEIAHQATFMRHIDEVTLAVTLAYLHDVLEDTDTTVNSIVEVFGVPVAACVEALTDPRGMTRRSRKRKLHERLSRVDETAEGFTGKAILIVKASDRLANMRRCVGLGDEPGNPEAARDVPRGGARIP